MDGDVRQSRRGGGGPHSSDGRPGGRSATTAVGWSATVGFGSRDRSSL